MSAFSPDDVGESDTSMDSGRLHESEDSVIDEVIASLKTSSLKRKKPQLRIEVVDLDPTDYK